MFSSLVMIIVCVGMALYGAWKTVQERNHLTHTHKRRHTDR